MNPVMAAVFALIFLPALAAVSLMFKATGGQLVASTIFALVCFAALAAGVFAGLYTMARHWEAE
jgi:hypothetical protein